MHWLPRSEGSSKEENLKKSGIFWHDPVSGMGYVTLLELIPLYHTDLAKGNTGCEKKLSWET